MQNILRLSSPFLFLIILFAPSVLATGHASIPQLSLPIAEAASTKVAALPVRLAIPSIKLTSAIMPMGVLSNGELDVPSGKTNNVGWYAKGTVPGEAGSAVLDAHVFAAFSKLDDVKVGDHIQVGMSDGTTRTFAVTKTKVYKLASLSSQELFGDGGKYIHLITCAGSLTPNHSTYTHRLVVYAELVD
jgi:LPXTG-site transpeptidase (sortase) family protein